MLKFGVLGPVTAHRAGLPADLRTAMLRRLVAILLCRPGQPMSVDSLLDALWEGEPPASARKTLQIYVHRLRRALGDDGRVPRGPTGYALTVQPGELDALLFAELTEQAAKTASHGDPSGASELFGKALGLWRGDAFADITCCGYVTRHAQMLEEQRLHALDQFASLELSLGRHSQLIGALAAACAANPYLETLRGHLMLALYRSGRQADALAEYRHLHQQMVDDLGVEPGTELRQLHERILRSEPRLTHAAAATVTSGPVKPAQLPLDIRFFTGRTAQLTELGSVLPLTGTTIVTITGTAGVGKTTTAVHWAHQVADRFDDGQLYVNLRGFDPSATVTAPAEALRGFLTALGVAAERIPTELEARTAMFRSLLADKQMLVLLDNARDADHVRPLLPGGGSCLVVVTSRNQLAGLVISEGAHPVPLDLLTEDESRQLLVGRLGGRVEADPAAATAMIARCARLPLALMVFAATALLRPNITLTALVADLRDIESDLDALAGDDPLTDVRAVLSWSYQALRARTASVFRLLAVHPGPEIGLNTAADLTGLSVDEATVALRELVDTHLLNETTPSRFTMHDLLHEYAAELLVLEEGDASRDLALHRLLDHYLYTAYAAATAFNQQRLPLPMSDAAPDTREITFLSHDSAHAWLTVEYAALCHCIDIATRLKADGHVWRMAWAISDISIRQARWSTLESVQRKALNAARRLDDHCGQGYAYRYLGIVAWEQGRDTDGTRLLHSALDQFAHAGRYAEQGALFVDLAAQHGEQPSVSLSYAQQALERYRRAGLRAGEASAMTAVGFAQSKMGKPREGLIHIKQALEMQLEIGDRYGAAASCATGGLAYYLLLDFDQAISGYERSIELYRQVGRPMYVADKLLLVGDAYKAVGRSSAARKAWQEAREIYDKLGVVKEDLARKMKELNEAG
ncbi:MAG TPA: hypothetical protein DGG94_03440 [Micromonosporaceae bacterium]|nr:hypothetical protein [Micromonosporaceae bacterium]HCU48869.1 hypothetical protein [Micromonosporaceae bacterium]